MPVERTGKVKRKGDREGCLQRPGRKNEKKKEGRRRFGFRRRKHSKGAAG